MGDLDDLTFDGRGRLVDALADVSDPGPPPDLTWSRFELLTLTADRVFGQMVALHDQRGLEINLVVVSEVFTDGQGAWVRVVPHHSFVRWSQTPAESRSDVPAPARAVAVRHLWFMHEARLGSG